MPYHLFVDPNEIYEIKMPNSQKLFKLQVVNRVFYTFERNHKMFGINYDEKLKNKSLYTETGDRFGICGYSKVEIIFDRLECVFDKSNNIDLDILNRAIEKFCAVFNYFLDRYAAVVKHRQPSKLSLTDINSLDIIYFDKTTNKPMFETYISTIHGATLSDKFPIPSHKVNNRLKKLLLNPEPGIDFLGVNAVRTIFSGDYLSGIVQGVTQLEAFIYKLYRTKLTEGKVEKIEDKLKSLGLTNLMEMLPLVLDESTYNNLIEVCDFSVVKSAITIRNNYIHKGETGNVTTFQASENYVYQLNLFCIELAKICGMDHMLDETELE